MRRQKSYLPMTPLWQTAGMHLWLPHARVCKYWSTTARRLHSLAVRCSSACHPGCHVQFLLRARNFASAFLSILCPSGNPLAAICGRRLRRAAVGPACFNCSSYHGNQGVRCKTSIAGRTGAAVPVSVGFSAGCSGAAVGGPPSKWAAKASVLLKWMLATHRHIAANVFWKSISSRARTSSGWRNLTTLKSACQGRDFRAWGSKAPAKLDTTPTIPGS